MALAGFLVACVSHLLAAQIAASQQLSDKNAPQWLGLCENNRLTPGFINHDKFPDSSLDEEGIFFASFLTPPVESP